MSAEIAEPLSPAVAELDRQTDVLVDKGYPGLAGMSEQAFRGLVAPLRTQLPAERFVLVVSPVLVPAERMIDAVDLAGRSGFTTMEPEDLARFQPIAEVSLSDSPAYLAVDPDTGADTLNVRPDDALHRILAAGRTPLTLAEGLALATQLPQWLLERNCFEMLGSRAGDKRVTGIWVSKGAPRLGWCWGGNPHTWLGMASAASRIG
ncbi:MAG: hypothetical protein JJD92_11960 [Frankiaceae bacterium]|nr:hypothetical protein [Frankiaceae bacterium]